MKWLLVSLLLGASVLCSLPTRAEMATPRVEVDAPYIDLRTGPGRGYPKFYVVERGDWIQLLKRRTDWVLVRTPRGKEGWLHVSELAKTLSGSRQPLLIQPPDYNQYLQRDWELGALAGIYDGHYELLSVYGGYRFMDDLLLELHVQQLLTDTGSNAYSLGLFHELFRWRQLSPYLGVGLGRVEAAKSRDSSLHFATGMRLYVTHQLFLRMEYRHNTRQDRNNNDGTEEWKLGIAVFF